MDKDSNGFISADELKSGIMENLEEKVANLIKEADIDGDGQIKGMSTIFFDRQDFRAVDIKSLIKAKNESVQIAPKMKSYYEYHI